SQVGADHRLVVDDHDFDRGTHAAGSAVGTYDGIVASRQNPPSGVPPARRVPCTSSMRWRRLAMPRAEPVAARALAGGGAAAGVLARSRTRQPAVLTPAATRAPRARLRP